MSEYNDNNNRNENESDEIRYSPEQKKEIRIHWAILFIVFYLVLSLSAMKALISYYPLVGHLVCIFLSGLMGYYMSFVVYRWKTEKGWWVYGIVIFIILLMLARYEL